MASASAVSVLGLQEAGAQTWEAAAMPYLWTVWGMIASLSCFSPTPSHTWPPRLRGKGHKSGWLCLSASINPGKVC